MTLEFVLMDRNIHISEVHLEASLSETATPLRCRRTMVAQSLVPWTPTRLLGAMFAVILSAPALLFQPAINRRRA
jgi:hypothetical protein